MDDNARTIYVRLPHTIRNADEIHDIFPGDIDVKLHRKASRQCHVVFPSIEEKMKNLRGVKKILINNKRIIARPLKKNVDNEEDISPIISKKNRKNHKRIIIPKASTDDKISRW